MTTTVVTRRAATDPAGSERRVGGLLLGTGAALMVLGAIVWTTTGTDMWAALDDGTIHGYLAEADEHRSALVANLVIWIFGAAALGAGGTVLAAEGQGPSAPLARATYPLGGALAVVSFTLWIALVRAGTSLDTTTAELLGFGVTRLDDIATIALIGLGPVLLAASSPGWMGPKLRRGAWVVGVAAALSTLAVFTHAQMSYGFVIVPAGIAWTIAAAVSSARATS